MLIKLISKSQKLDRIFYIDPSQEGDMMKFLKMCAEMLNEGGEIHMILKETDFQLFKVEEHAHAVKIFIKEVIKFFEGYCEGFTLSSRKVTTASEALEESISKESEIVERSLVNTEFGRVLLDMSRRDSNESKLASVFVGEFLGRDMSKPLADLERTKVLYTPKRGVIHGGLIRELLLNEKDKIQKACISLEMPPVTFILPGSCSRQGTSRSND